MKNIRCIGLFQVVQLFYTHVFTKPKDTYAKTTQLGVTFASGYTAGVICAIVSHPADSLVSLLGKPANKGKSLGQIINETGFAKLATKVKDGYDLLDAHALFIFLFLNRRVSVLVSS